MWTLSCVFRRRTGPGEAHARRQPLGPWPWPKSGICGKKKTSRKTPLLLLFQQLVSFWKDAEASRVTKCSVSTRVTSLWEGWAAYASTCCTPMWSGEQCRSPQGSFFISRRSLPGKLWFM